jgi:hypothetical protein
MSQDDTPGEPVNYHAVSHGSYLVFRFSNLLDLLRPAASSWKLLSWKLLSTATILAVCHVLRIFDSMTSLHLRCVVCWRFWGSSLSKHTGSTTTTRPRTRKPIGAKGKQTVCSTAENIPVALYVGRILSLGVTT